MTCQYTNYLPDLICFESKGNILNNSSQLFLIHDIFAVFVFKFKVTDQNFYNFAQL